INGVINGSSAKPLLFGCLGMMIGVWILAPNGHFLFHRFGLSVPVAATVGCLVGAALGYACTHALFHLRTRKQRVIPVLRITEREVRAGLHAAWHGLSGRHA
ncbi:MAG: hypothetical protein KGM92_05215, partial [Acidobacteriota bacterium]|nr:hypothetical protein [Acidobacteriota bacterium]